MYPQTFTELMALLSLLVPLVIATIAGLQASRTKALENKLVRWRRINELTRTLYNKGYEQGFWAQLAAVHELGEVASPHKAAADAILSGVQSHFSDNETLIEASEIALARVRRGWLRRNRIKQERNPIPKRRGQRDCPTHN